MNFFRYLHITLMLFSIVSCSANGGGSGTGDGEETNIVPTNLIVNYEVVGASNETPNGDGSGEVTFSVSADNAEEFEVYFGDGNSETYTQGSFSYTYKEQGTETYTVNVFAISSTGDQIKESIDITVSKELGVFWSEEFDYTGAPNSEFWSFEIGDGCPNLCGWGNNEAQYYTDSSDNVEVKDGSLFIRARKESIGGKSYTSTRMITKGKFEFYEGKIEIRAKLPQGGGTWPAFWMLGGDIDQVGWPRCGEIDIMEHVGNNPGEISSALHTQSSYGNTQNVKKTGIDDPYTEFHVYGLNWTADKMEFSLDGNVFYTYAPANKDNNNWPFYKDCFFIFNIAVGGNLGGQIDSSWEVSEMEIDYIRVYK